MPLKSPVRKVIRKLNIKKIFFPKCEPENTLIKFIQSRDWKIGERVIISKCIPGDWQIGERINIIMLRMISFLEIRNWRKGDYIEMYSGRLADWRKD